MIKLLLFPLAVFVVSGFALTACRQIPGLSTSEEKKDAVQKINFLETQPLAAEAERYRGDLITFLVKSTDIAVNTPCVEVFGGLKNFEGDYATELLKQSTFSQAKFTIKNPDRANDKIAVYLAGVQGVMRAWEAIKKEQPKAEFKVMDELLERQKAGTLGEYVNANAAKCK